ncbi:MAG TPA: hypothetical protein VK750_05100 [Cytophagaceae bacterium]|jgi:hypothetical protein|nr:hypothetical protein [Cytophagaceae bacterium]
MKRNPLFRIIFFTLFYLSIHFSSQAQTVYVTNGGKKYHMKNCSAVSSGKKGVEVSEAKKQGYSSCAVCKPDEKKGTAAEDLKKKNK